MRTRLFFNFLAFCFLLSVFNSAQAQTVPVIKYSPANNNFPISTAITSLTPANTGGAVQTNGWSINPALPTGLAFSTVTGVISGTPTAATAAAIYTVTAANASGSGTADITIAVGAVNNWVGSGGGPNGVKWANASNWSNGVPTATDLVQIGVVAYSSNKQPTLITAQTVNSITFGPNTGNTLPTLTITGVKLTVSNAFTVNEAGTSANPTITGTGSVDIAPGASLNVGSGDVFYTTLTGKLTLKSNATGSASVGQIATTSIAGTGADSIHVERFITGGTGHRGYYLLSSPVYAAAVSPNNVYDLHYLIYGGMYLTGTTGFDLAGNPSLYLYREDQIPTNTTFTGGNFWGISTFNNATAYNYNLNGGPTTYNLPVGNGYMVFFRGARSGGTLAAETVTTFTTAPTVTLVASGILNAGQVTVHDWFTPGVANLSYTTTIANTSVRGFNLVGNPYASSIDWETFNTTSSITGIYGVNVSNTIYEYNILTHNYDTYQVGGSATNDGSRTIVSGQGFFVQANGASPQLIFNESAKSTAAQNVGATLFMSTRADIITAKTSAPAQYLRLELAKDSINKDNIYIGFNANSSSKYVLNEDAPYIQGTGQVNLASLSSDHIALAINKMPLPTTNSDTIFLKLHVTATGAYNFNMLDTKSMPDLYEVWLMDAYTKDSVNMRQTASYAFNINLADTTTYGSKRFSLVVRENTAKQMRLVYFSAVKVSKAVQTNWKTKNEQGYTVFTVERSIDKGVTFNPIGGFTSSSQGSYSLTDNNPFNGENQYRLKLIDVNGVIKYSNVSTVNYSAAGSNNIVVYPNPVKTTLNVVLLPAGNASGFTAETVSSISSLLTSAGKTDEYSITIVNNLGAVIKTAQSNQLTWQTDVSKFLPGTYIIQVVSKSGKGITGQATFIKL